jgi:hypothetical protein
MRLAPATTAAIEIVKNEYVRCGNCGLTHFSHLILPDVGMDVCPYQETRFRPATEEDYTQWGIKKRTRMSVADTRLAFRR